MFRFERQTFFRGWPFLLAPEEGLSFRRTEMLGKFVNLSMSMLFSVDTPRNTNIDRNLTGSLQ